MLDLVGGWKWSDGRAVGPNQWENAHFSMEMGMRVMNLVQVFFLRNKILSAVKRVEFVSDRMSYIILRGPWCHVIVLNVVKNNSDEELECVFNKFPKYLMKILFGNVSAKIGR
jgi:hypothetical protein